MTSDDDNDRGDLGGGYCRPPKEHQFKPGQSGNPRGRPKRAQNLKTLLVKELAGRVTGAENGRTIRVSKMELMIKSMVTRAIKGDQRASEQVVRLVAQTIGLDSGEPARGRLLDDDAAILREFLNHHAEDAKPADHGSGTDAELDRSAALQDPDS